MRCPGGRQVELFLFAARHPRSPGLVRGVGVRNAQSFYDSLSLGWGWGRCHGWKLSMCFSGGDKVSTLKRLQALNPPTFGIKSCYKDFRVTGCLRLRFISVGFYFEGCWVADLSLFRYVGLLLIILACYGFCFCLHLLKDWCVGPTSKRRVGTHSIKEKEGGVGAENMIWGVSGEYLAWVEYDVNTRIGSLSNCILDIKWVQKMKCKKHFV